MHKGFAHQTDSGRDYIGLRGDGVVEHVLIRYARGGIDEYRIHVIIATEQARGTSGSGLGLSIVKRIADLHGAGIVLGEGLNGKGLRVKVVFAPA